MPRTSGDASKGERAQWLLVFSSDPLTPEQVDDDVVHHMVGLPGHHITTRELFARWATGRLTTTEAR